MSTWSQRADETFVVGMPARGRIVLEMVLLVALVFSSAIMMSTIVVVTIVSFELALAIFLVRPWSHVHGGVAMRALAAIIVLLAVVAPSLVERPSFASESRRLGVGVAIAAREDGDPAWDGGMARVERVEHGTSADGVLHAGDRIVAIGGAPLDATDPTSDLTRRTHGNELPEDTTVTVMREHRIEQLPVHLPRAGANRHFGTALAAVRDLASRHIVVAAALRGVLLIALVIVLLRANGQPISSLGIAWPGALREVLASTWMTAGAFALMIAVAIPIGIIGMRTGAVERESAQRSETLGTLASQGSLIELALAMVVAAAFEEITFRAFLTPRMRVIVGSWPIAVILVAIVFGAGHVYEGFIATFQTAMLGIYFAVMMLIRRRILGPSLAHAAFNTIMLVFIRIITSSHLVERLRAMQH